MIAQMKTFVNSAEGRGFEDANKTEDIERICVSKSEDNMFNENNLDVISTSHEVLFVYNKKHLNCPSECYQIFILLLLLLFKN